MAGVRVGVGAEAGNGGEGAVTPVVTGLGDGKGIEVLEARGVC